ncbi:CRISPR-associated helicase/endonuclease Cas3 [Proteiniphilum acetatigenes]|uniref:CRISPR-associated helicase/endonuclease Cas3 n=1 Tax=Proteiniphilum acetatigenes TaxID=294710 RepID=UPI000372AF87|nr:CRISPR-associated helicase/endonuclease Cas3 [Proteiniphilum acetatigenes]SEA34693.1 CRISPR-associated helicase, Cas3 family [Porphyromonadaceae bacterium KH3R12]
MVSDIERLKSHPDKLLLNHIQGVRDNVKKLTNSHLAELVALLHDLGKINPNFQDKLDPEKTVNGYSNHAYLSGYAFFCAFCCNRNNFEVLKQFLQIEDLTQNDLIALVVIIAKHHGNLPDFCPKDYTGTGASILSKDETFALFRFLNHEQNLPVCEFIRHFLPIEDFRQLLFSSVMQKGYSEQLVFRDDKNKLALDFFLDFQFAFACVLQADKADAGKIGGFIDKQQQDVRSFSENFSSQLNLYLNKLDQNSELNKLRTKIRDNALQNIFVGLKSEKHVFELTAPTGSGKTLMMLSLASEIIKEKGAKRIIYALPFLSITEQVETEVLKIFGGQGNFIQRIDSKSENIQFENLQKELDGNPTKENILEASILEFQENTFAYPFVITTFVRFFETLLSNRNAELLKLPNFSNCIFLLDEIQALPPRLYGFFVAYLSRFCEKFNSYAIISTATQPNFELPKDNQEAIEFFKDYSRPYPLLPLNYFDSDLFNRYQINYFKNSIDLETLKESILAENRSVLVILNTIDDTKELYKLLQDELGNEELLLLNTHFTPRHRKIKIYMAKRRLREDKKIIVISTQLIEAGVDIDFPIVYRDFTTVASIVQSAGRCNRDGKLQEYGKVKLIRLQKNGQERVNLIFRNRRDKDILKLTYGALKGINYQEKDLLRVQKAFFDSIQKDLDWGKHSQCGPKFEFDFIKDIQECMYNKIGQFRLIDKQLFGEERQYYVAEKDSDDSFEKLLALDNGLMTLLKNNADASIIRIQRKKIEMQIKKMSLNIVNVRFTSHNFEPVLGNEKSYYNLYKLSNSAYSFELGVDLRNSFCII